MARRDIDDEHLLRLEELGIRHILAAAGKSTTTGKIEWRSGTYDREAWWFETLDDFLFYYNQVRPHQSLDYEKPLEVFLADPLPFH
jgi:putative transposase